MTDSQGGISAIKKHASGRQQDYGLAQPACHPPDNQHSSPQARKRKAGDAAPLGGAVPLNFENWRQPLRTAGARGNLQRGGASSAVIDLEGSEPPPQQGSRPESIVIDLTVDGPAEPRPASPLQASPSTQHGTQEKHTSSSQIPVKPTSPMPSFCLADAISPPKPAASQQMQTCGPQSSPGSVNDMDVIPARGPAAMGVLTNGVRGSGDSTQASESPPASLASNFSPASPQQPNTLSQAARVDAVSHQIGGVSFLSPVLVRHRALNTSYTK